MSIFVCELCRGRGKDFRLPADKHGVAIMETHLWDEHGVRTPNWTDREIKVRRRDWSGALPPLQEDDPEGQDW